MANKKVPAKRRPNFSRDEEMEIVDGVALHYDGLHDQFAPKLTAQTRENLWEEILENVNAKSTADPPRTVDEIKKKFQQLKSKVKAAAAFNKREMGATGGGQAKIATLNAVGEKILELIPQVEVDGIVGGLDSSAREYFTTLVN